MVKERLDGKIVNLGLVSSRSQAQQLIKDGVVVVNGEVARKPSLRVSENDEVNIKKEKIWVGRGAEKIAGAHRDFNLVFEDKVIADMGASTGGFTQYALYHGAQKVFAVDVGRDQLADELTSNPKVFNLEGTNIKDGVALGELCDLIVVDLSFISLRLVLEPIVSIAKKNAELVILFKPQFEVGREAIGKKGIVKDLDATTAAMEKVYDNLVELGCSIKKISPCQITGKTGNQEYFFYCIYDSEPSGYSRNELQKLILQS